MSKALGRLERADLRDMMLPRPMSSALRVKDAEKLVGERV